LHNAALSQLEDAELLCRTRPPPEVHYSFKHGLVQDAAYETLLKSRRQVLHRHIAEALRDRFSSLADTEPEIVAHHFTQAGLAEAAAEWWGKAAERAMQSSAHNEAIRHLRNALGLVDELADTPEHRLLRLRLQTTYGLALKHGRGTASPEASAAFARAFDLATQVENASEKFSAYYGMVSSTIIRADIRQARDVAQAFLSDTLHGPGSQEAGRILGTTCWASGDYVEAKLHLEQALAARDSDWYNDNRIVQRFGYDFRGGFAPMIYLGLVLWPLGEFERALLLMEAGLGLALQSKHHATIAVSRCWACLLAAIRGKPGEAEPHAQAAVALASEHDLPYWFALGTTFLGWSRTGASTEQRINEMRQGIQLLREQGVGFMMPLLGTLLAQAEAQTGALDDALATVEAQLVAIDRTGERWFAAEVHRCQGALLLCRETPNAVAAEVAFKRATEIARTQQTRSFELRAALSFAKLYQATGRGEAARDLLAPAVAGFTEGPELPEVEQANRLLADLAKRADSTEVTKAASQMHP
jgi:tetratricopeptide (TPR) repeat protein